MLRQLADERQPESTTLGPIEDGFDYVVTVGVRLANVATVVVVVGLAGFESLAF